jgi:Spy/CpxP family protein refolding chaperone
MHKLSAALFVCLAINPILSQTGSIKYQPGTILGVERHQEPDSASSPVRYDVTVQIDDTVYVVLYTPLYGSNTVEYAAGIEKIFGVGQGVLLFPGNSDRLEQLPILQTRDLPPTPAIDWSRAPGHYFSMKMKNLTQSLDLSDQQQVKIKQIAEQETAEASGVIFTPVVSRKERLGQWEKIVRKSDAKMKPILSEAQWQKLQEMRKDQQRELKGLISEHDARGK